MALTARLGYGTLRTLPLEPEIDEKGLRMEMVYWSPPRELDFTPRA